MDYDKMSDREADIHTGCGYQGYEFGAGFYPDSICLDGRLFDADNCDDDGNLYEPGVDIPCPVCKPLEAVKYWAEYNELSGGAKSSAKKAARSLIDDIRTKRGLPVLAALACGKGDKE